MMLVAQLIMLALWYSVAPHLPAWLVFVPSFAMLGELLMYVGVFSAISKR